MIGTSLNQYRMIRLVLAACALGLALGQACAQDGKLIDDVVMEFRETALAQIETDFPGTRDILKSVQLHHITYLSDGLKVKGYLAAPKKGGRLPCVIFNRGGNREFGALRSGRAAALLGRVANWGYVVVASQYRGNDGGEGREEFGGADVNDVLNLMPLLQSWPQADASRIGMYGWSRGGMMTYLALTPRLTSRRRSLVLVLPIRCSGRRDDQIWKPMFSLS